MPSAFVSFLPPPERRRKSYQANSQIFVVREEQQFAKTLLQPEKEAGGLEQEAACWVEVAYLTEDLGPKVAEVELTPQERV